MGIGVFLYEYSQKNEEAVSPVIGVILMVAITVILAAVNRLHSCSASPGNIQKTKVVAATEYRVNGSFVQVTYQGGQDSGTMGGDPFQVDGANSTTNQCGVQRLPLQYIKPRRLDKVSYLSEHQRSFRLRPPVRTML